MGISAALGNAVSGLRANAVQTDVISKNISNGSTEGYTRKTVKLDTVGGNVTVSSIDRQVSSLLDRLDRGNISKLSNQQTVAEGVSAYTDFLGQPDDESSPSALLAELKGAMIGFSGSVNDGGSQNAVVSAAKELASQMNRLSSTAQAVQKEVELNINYDVSDLNTALYEVAKLNSRIASSAEGSQMAASLEDDMGRALDKIASLMDVQTKTSDNGMISITTSGGTELLRGVNVHDVRYESATGQLTAGTVNITPGAGNRAFSDGSIGGLFILKNETLPAISSQLDAMSAAMVEGFERVAPISADGRSLFTDAGAAYDPLAVDGLASRLRVHEGADPDTGGNPEILQNGGNPAVTSGDNSIALAMVQLFNDPVAVPTAGLGTNLTLSVMVSTMVGNQQQQRVDAERSAATTSAAAATISSSRLNLQGVNIDDELQKLMLVEQSYAANAKVLTTVDAMMDSLMNAIR